MRCKIKTAPSPPLTPSLLQVCEQLMTMHLAGRRSAAGKPSPGKSHLLRHSQLAAGVPDAIVSHTKGHADVVDKIQRYKICKLKRRPTLSLVAPLRSVQKCHFRPRKAAEVAVRPPTAPRPPHTLCGHRRRRDTSPRGSAERSAPPPALRRAPRSGLGEFWRVPNILYSISWCVFGARSICSTCSGPKLVLPRSHRSPRH